MYSRKNAYASSPGVWFTDDGEFEIYRGHRPGYATDWWYVIYRAYFDYARPADDRRTRSRVVGIEPTLNAAFATAGRYYAHPVVPVDSWPYPADASNAVCEHAAHGLTVELADGRTLPMCSDCAATAITYHAADVVRVTASGCGSHPARS